MHACRPSFDKGGPWNDCSYCALPIEASVPDLLPLCTPLHRFRGEHSSDHSSSPHASTHIAHRTGLTALGQANKSMSPGVVAGPHRCRAHSCPIAARSSARVTSIVPVRRSSCPSHLMSPLSVRIARSTHPAPSVRGHRARRKVIPGSPRGPSQYVPVLLNVAPPGPHAMSVACSTPATQRSSTSLLPAQRLSAALAAARACQSPRGCPRASSTHPHSLSLLSHTYVPFVHPPLRPPRPVWLSNTYVPFVRPPLVPSG